MQTGNQTLNTLAYVWMNGLYIYITLAEVSVFNNNNNNNNNNFMCM